MMVPPTLINIGICGNQVFALNNTSLEINKCWYARTAIEDAMNSQEMMPLK